MKERIRDGHPAITIPKTRTWGQVLISVALMLPVLMGIVGFAVDMGRLYAAQTRLQTAVDAAALAGSLWLMEDPDLKNGQVRSSVQEYLTLNFAGARVTGLNLGTDVRSVDVCAMADVDMTFTAVLGIRSRSVSACARAGFSDLEIALVIDNTNSMHGKPIADTKRAANQLVAMILPDNVGRDQSPPVKVALVPFRGKVRIAEGADGLPDGCRTRDGRVNQGAVHETCLEPLTPVLPLSFDKSVITRHINQMVAPGGEANSGTLIMEGLKWGREVLTPSYPFEQGGPTARFRKVVILLSDGRNSWYSPYDAFRAQPMNWQGCNNQTCRDNETRREADLAKDQGVEIFVIRYGSSAPAHAVELLRYIASSRPGTDDHYFDAPNSDDIPAVMRLIGRKLAYRLIS